MPSKYVKSARKRTYRKYSSKDVLNAVAAVKTGQLSIRKASKLFGVPYGTIFNKKNGLHTLKNGGQTKLSQAAENELAQTILIAGEWGFPLTKNVIQQLVRDFMESNNTGNHKLYTPGKDWFRGFLERHKEVLSLRQSQSIKRNRAAVSPELVNSYFDKLTVVLNGVPAENIINYDETNFVDNPGLKKVVIRRGQKHADNVLDHSKSSYSVMFAAAANGFVFAPYVVYASVHLYTTWTEGGPQGARYNRSKSGWFDKTIFEDWFFSMALPYFKKLSIELPKVIIGDNVASHLSYKVMRSCLENNIRFVFLPPNATHLCQPLDVAFFRPLKLAWRNTLHIWKKRNTGPVPKHIFPRLLKETLLSIDKSSSNVISGFKATGIYPCNRQAVLKKLPGANDSFLVAENEKQENSFSKQLIALFKAERYSPSQNTALKRKRIVKIEPGESIGEEHIANFDMDNYNLNIATNGTTAAFVKVEPSTSVAPKMAKRKLKRENLEKHASASEINENDDPKLSKNEPCVNVAVKMTRKILQRKAKCVLQTTTQHPMVRIKLEEGGNEEYLSETNTNVSTDMFAAAKNRDKPKIQRGRQAKPKLLR